MQEICTYGSVRGVPGNRHSYRDKGVEGVEGSGFRSAQAAFHPSFVTPAKAGNCQSLSLLA